MGHRDRGYRRHPWLHRIAWLRRNRCSLLLTSLCLMILANPAFGDSALGPRALSISLLAILVVGTWALRMPRRVVLMVAGLAVLTAWVILSVPDDRHWMRPVAHGTMAVFTAVVTIALLRYVLDRHLINTDKVFGAVAAYVLIAISFACLFLALQYVQGNSFYINEVNNPDGLMSWSDAMYFSFTVLTSTGFGEITPVTDMARSLIVIEQVLGVMYVAFLVARLANLYGRIERR
jgi:ion channel